MYNQIINISITLNINNYKIVDDDVFYKQTLYLNGKKTRYDGWYNKQQWDKFLNLLPGLNYFIIGRCSMNGPGNWHYSKMSCYSLKLYNRALTEEEVLDSYNKDIAYHQFLVNGGTVGTVEGNDVINY